VHRTSAYGFSSSYSKSGSPCAKCETLDPHCGQVCGAQSYDWGKLGKVRQPELSTLTGREELTWISDRDEQSRVVSCRAAIERNAAHQLEHGRYCHRFSSVLLGLDGTELVLERNGYAATMEKFLVLTCSLECSAPARTREILSSCWYSRSIQQIVCEWERRS
jgi:hypothetical protein